jgi:hypothetical protein
MEIKTKYNIGDKVFYMHDNKVCDGIIASIEAIVIADMNTRPLEHYTTIYYNLCGMINIKKCETYCFNSKEELIKTL